MAKKDKASRRVEQALEAAPPPQSGSGLLAARKLAAKLAAAELCYGEPVRAGESVVIPVARVSAAGAVGFGRGADPEGGDGSGWGGGGSLDAAPVGFIEVGAGGARFHAIPDPIGKARALRTGASALAAIGAAVSMAAMRRRRSGPGRRRLGR